VTIGERVTFSNSASSLTVWLVRRLPSNAPGPNDRAELLEFGEATKHLPEHEACGGHGIHGPRDAPEVNAGGLNSFYTRRYLCKRLVFRDSRAGSKLCRFCPPLQSPDFCRADPRLPVRTQRPVSDQVAKSTVQLAVCKKRKSPFRIVRESFRL